MAAPVTQVAALAIYWRLGHTLPQFGAPADLLEMFLIFSIGSAGEEIGWRGFFLARALSGKSLIAATAWTAFFWGLWHLPFYFAVDAESQPGRWLVYLVFLFGMFPVSSFFVLIYARTKSLLLCCLFHGSLDAGAAYWFSSVPTGSGQTLLIALWMAVLWIAAVPVFLKLIRGTPRVNWI